MTIKDFIESLSKYPPELDVYVKERSGEYLTNPWTEIISYRYDNGLVFEDRKTEKSNRALLIY